MSITTSFIWRLFPAGIGIEAALTLVANFTHPHPCTEDVFIPELEHIDQLRSALKEAKLSSDVLAAQLKTRTASESLKSLTSACSGLQDDVNKRLSLPYNPRCFFSTDSHIELAYLLISTVSALSRNQFAGKRGLCSKTIVGTKGIGKTTMLRAFCSIGAAFFPNVIPVYVSLLSCTDANSVTYECSLLRLVSQQLKASGRVNQFEYITGNRNHFVFLRQILEAKQLYLLVIVDEVDELFKINPKTHEKNTNCALQTLQDLRNLGNQDSGRFAVILSGSSAMLPLLITSNTKAYDEFPLLERSSSINGDKFKSHRVPVSPPCDFVTVAAMFPSAPSDAVARLVAFVGGCRARGVQRLIVQQGAVSPSMIDSAAFEEQCEARRTLSGALRGVFNVLMEELQKKNKPFFDTLKGNYEKSSHSSDDTIDDVNVRVICENDWKILPLNVEDLSIAVKKANVLDEKNQDLDLKEHYLFPLADRDYIVLCGSSSDEIYPASAYRLFTYHQVERLKQNTKKSLAAAFPSVAVATVAKAVATTGIALSCVVI